MIQLLWLSLKNFRLNILFFILDYYYFGSGGLSFHSSLS
uniref:Uncharacterized protein n=1 Tax=Utricularia reniformis TaxID=192314 RepID=A0A1Y0B3T5_9LAMI|nr:hypothetical protein AEK19_MT0824 [Utricularia reniformis]YP_009382314.1 hypothetical protein AEK19_MT1886 [Utricularia reniformis]ART31058.1 hypothetical protein AEK19_MT0824 [Utricularia reniformis]ART32054.1 hypothetical protein AEK19_MT1886 [Utricularia reniformis]